MSDPIADQSKEIRFSPFTVFLGIVLGTLFAIAFCSSIVGVIFWMLSDESPRLASEIKPLAVLTAIFIVLTAFAAASFLGTLHRKPWRYLPLAALWLGLVLAGNHYWP